MDIFNNYYQTLNLDMKKYFHILAEEIPDFLKPYLETKTLFRLKDISYFCAMDYGKKDLYNFKFPISRLDHSLSTALIIWNFTKDKNQTIAALFHDARTPATSHVIDYLNEDYITQESTEVGLINTLAKDKKLLELLNKDNISLEDVTNFKNYPLIDSKRPKLCADRLDGIFLSSLSWAKNITLEEVEKIYLNLNIVTNEDNEPEFNLINTESADKLVSLNARFNELTNDPLDFNSMLACAMMVRYLINHNYLNYEDLFEITDVNLFTLINYYSDEDETLNNLYLNFKNLLEIEVNNIPKLKQRYLNPLVLSKRYSK